MYLEGKNWVLGFFLFFSATSTDILVRKVLIGQFDKCSSSWNSVEKEFEEMIWECSKRLLRTHIAWLLAAENEKLLQTKSFSAESFRVSARPSSSSKVNTIAFILKYISNAKSQRIYKQLFGKGLENAENTILLKALWTHSCWSLFLLFSSVSWT